VIVFVSYSRQDNDFDALRDIEKRVARMGEPYIDDLYDHTSGDRQVTVHRALGTAGLFVAVHSPNYPKTVWTCMEYQLAVTRGLSIVVMANGVFMAHSEMPL
jgi:hypothetical protein